LNRGGYLSLGCRPTTEDKGKTKFNLVIYELWFSCGSWKCGRF